MYVDLICPETTDVNEERYLLHVVVEATNYGIAKSMRTKTASECQRKFHEAKTALQAMTTPGVSAENNGYCIERVKHDPGSEFEGRFRDYLETCNILNARGLANRHTHAALVEGANRIIQVNAVKLLHTALGESEEYRAALQLEAMKWARTLMNRKPTTERQREHGSTPEMEQMGVDPRTANMEVKPWGCLAYGWIDQKDRMKVKCGDKCFLAVWTGHDDYVTAGHRLVPIMWSEKDRVYTLSSTRVCTTVQFRESCFPLKHDASPDIRHDYRYMGREEMTRLEGHVKTRSQIEHREMKDLGDGEDEVERIVGHKGKGTRLFRVRWLGYSEEHDTWHRAEDLEGAKGVLEEYMEESGLNDGG